MPKRATRVQEAEEMQGGLAALEGTPQVVATDALGADTVAVAARRAVGDQYVRWPSRASIGDALPRPLLD